MILLSAVLLTASCGTPTEDQFAADFLLYHTGWSSIAVHENISTPAWDSEESFWIARESENTILRQLDLEGNILDTITLYLYPDASRKISDTYISSDGREILFTIESDDSSVRDLCRIQVGSSNHNLFTLDGVRNIRLPNPAGLYISSPVYPWPDTVGYIGTQIDGSSGSATQNFYMYDFNSAVTHSFYLGQYQFNQDGTVSGGDYYFNPDIYADSANPGSMEQIMFSVRQQNSPDLPAVYTIKMMADDGSETYDGSRDYQFEEIGGIRWLNQETLLMTVRDEGRWKIVYGNSQSEITEIYRAVEGVAFKSGLSLSPDKSKCTVQIYREGHEYQVEVLTVLIPNL